MGTRAQVYVKDTKVYLYAHCSGSELIENVHEALMRKQRWDDPPYLTRIIFETMIKDELGKEMGYGIDTCAAPIGTDLLITVDCKNQTVIAKKHEEIIFERSFEDFIKNKI